MLLANAARFFCRRVCHEGLALNLLTRTWSDLHWTITNTQHQREVSAWNQSCCFFLLKLAVAKRLTPTGTLPTVWATWLYKQRRLFKQVLNARTHSPACNLAATAGKTHHSCGFQQCFLFSVQNIYCKSIGYESAIKNTSVFLWRCGGGGPTFATRSKKRIFLITHGMAW